jgi:hypothetical protein
VLKEHNCFSEFDELAKALGSEQWLMYAIVSIQHASESHSRLQDDTARMDSRKLRTLLDKTRWVARAWEWQFRTPFGKEVLKFAAKCDSLAGEEELLKIPLRLLSLAVWASDIHRKTKHRRRPLYDDNLAALVEYVKLKTGDYHDRQVSALVCFAIKADSYDANTLGVWRSEHKRALSRARLRLKKH